MLLLDYCFKSVHENKRSLSCKPADYEHVIKCIVDDKGLTACGVSTVISVAKRQRMASGGWN